MNKKLLTLLCLLLLSSFAFCDEVIAPSDNKDTSTTSDIIKIENAFATDVVVPHDFVPSSNAKTVKNKDVNNIMSSLVIDTLAVNTAMRKQIVQSIKEDTSNFETLKKLEDYSNTSSSKFNEGNPESYSLRVSVKYEPKTYSLPYGSAKAIKYSANCMDDYAKDTKTLIKREDDHMIFTYALTSRPILAKERGATEPLIMGKICNENKISEKTVCVNKIAEPSLDEYKNNEVINAAVLFDNGTYYGIAQLSYSDVNSATPPMISITFYDLKGNKTSDTIQKPFSRN